MKKIFFIPILYIIIILHPINVQGSILNLDTDAEGNLKKISRQIDLTDPCDFNEALNIGLKLKEIVMKWKPASGLTAPQVGINKSIFVFSHDMTHENLKICINPTYDIITEDGITLSIESCISDCHCTEYIIAEVLRASKIVAHFYDENKNKQEMILGDVAARLFQHEYDHLNGTTLPDITSKDIKFNTKHDMKKFIFETPQKRQ